MRPSDLRFRLQRAVYRWQRLRLRAIVDQHYLEILAQLDHAAFRARFREYWNPFPGHEAYKFLDLNTWFRESVMLYHVLHIGTADQPLRILDLGAGCGYFLVVCRHFGHDVRGLDVDDEPLYRDAFDFFKLPRLTHRILPYQPLPSLHEKVDLISGFLTCFDRYADGSPWGPNEWRFFLDDLRERLTDRGRVYFRFNLNRRDGSFYSKEVERVFRAHAGFRVRFFVDFAMLKAE